MVSSTDSYLFPEPHWFLLQDALTIVIWNVNLSYHIICFPLIERIRIFPVQKNFPCILHVYNNFHSKVPFFKQLCNYSLSHPLLGWKIINPVFANFSDLLKYFQALTHTKTIILSLFYNVLLHFNSITPLIRHDSLNATFMLTYSAFR